MKSTSYQRAIVVGIFVFLGLAIFIITVLTLGSQHKTFERTLIVKSFFDDVNGLQKGNNVWFSGVKVGTVGNVKLQEDGKVEVDIKVEVQSVKYIPKNAMVKLSTDGLIGNKIIEIYGGTPGTPSISNGDILNNEKQIATDEMMNTLSKNNDNLFAITNSFKLISSRLADGKGSLGKLLTDESLSIQLNETINSLHRASENLEKLSSNIAVYTSKLNSNGTLANDLVTDTIIFSKLRATVSKLENIADSSQSVISNLKATTNTINTGLKSGKSPAGLLLNDEHAANQIKMTLENLQLASKKLNEDLEAAKHNFLLRGYFRKQAKKVKEDSTQN
jgi:phospholipid/cholesterol/gamma-HCH transport system substrate-binding protein